MDLSARLQDLEGGLRLILENKGKYQKGNAGVRGPQIPGGSEPQARLTHCLRSYMCATKKQLQVNQNVDCGLSLTFPLKDFGKSCSLDQGS